MPDYKNPIPLTIQIERRGEKYGCIVKPYLYQVTFYVGMNFKRILCEDKKLSIRFWVVEVLGMATEALEPILYCPISII